MSADQTDVLTTARREGNSEAENELIDFLKHSNPIAWSVGYALLRRAIIDNRRDIAKMILMKIDPEIDSKRFALEPEDAWNSILKIDKFTTLEAVIKGDVQNLQMLLDKYEDNHDLYITAVLHIAVRNNKIAIVELLVHRGADVNFIFKGLTPLHVAINEDCVQIAEYLLKNGASIHSEYFDGRNHYTPLKLAIIMHNDILVRLLLENGAKIDEYHYDTLRLAYSKGHSIITAYTYIGYLDLNPKDRNELLDAVVRSETEYRTIFQSLLKDCQHSDFGDRTMMLRLLVHAAVKAGFIQVVQLFESLGLVDVNAVTVHSPQSQECQTLLHSAVKDSKMDMIDYLIQIGSDVNVVDGDQKSSILYAIEYDNVEITKLLIRSGARIENTPEFLSNVAVRANREILETLLEYDPDIDINAKDVSGDTALHYSIKGRFNGNSHYKTNVELLLKRGADVNARGNGDSILLHLAIQVGYVNTFKILVAYYAKINAGGFWRKPLPECFNNGITVAIVKLLVANNADVNAKNERGETALHHATKSGIFEIVKLLLKHGAEVNVGDVHGMTPLHECCGNNRTIGSNSNVAICKLLLANNADVDAKSEKGETALHRASRCGKFRILELLLMHGAEINARGEHGMTSLHYASFPSGNQTETIEVLLRFGSDINAICNDGITPFELCIEKSPSVWHSVIDIYNREIIKRRVTNLYVGEEYSRLLDVDKSEFSSFEESCKKEIVKMRGSKIIGSVSFYEILRKDVHDISMYAKNKIIVQTLQSEEWREKFPIYCHRILYNFKRAQMREVLLDRSISSFNFLIGHEFLDVLTMEILRYLSDEDIGNLIKVR